MFIIKFPDQTFLTKPEAVLYANFLSNEHYSQFSRVDAIKFENENDANVVAKIVGGKVQSYYTTQHYEVGKTYLTIGGDHFTVVTKTENTVCDEIGRHRYSRTYGIDNGRTTGSKWTRDCLRYPPEMI